ncbi:MAG: hypothetical protein EPO11_02555 [Gammaproteobacteria bacterium]|nr:MAG: hypothetical protein EPO11_02555 [Gammaproteobacteria bacterium]
MSQTRNDNDTNLTSLFAKENLKLQDINATLRKENKQLREQISVLIKKNQQLQTKNEALEKQLPHEIEASLLPNMDDVKPNTILWQWPRPKRARTEIDNPLKHQPSKP